MKVLVTDGAGYIGSHITLGLIDKNFDVVVLDDLSTGFNKLVHKKDILIEGDYSDLNLLNHIFKNYNLNAIIHCAGDPIVEESVRDTL